jgi:hypothetical protein
LSCVGAAVPTPTWAAYSANSGSAPATCADGSNASSFADAAPSVTLFDRSYAAARRWTGNLNWSSMWRFLTYSLDAAYSYNFDQPGVVDLNYNGKQQFTLTNEDSRPIFVAPTSIVPSTGLVSPLDARVSQSYGRVLSRRSDIRSDVKQATITILPVPPQRFSKAFVNASYTYSASSSLSSGFEDNTFGDPRVREWSVGQFPAHQLRTQVGYRFHKLNSSITTSWIFQSGFAYTPVVAGDINGDGVANDRAFVFNPATAPPPVAAGMRDLLSSTSAEARDCLERQLAAVAQRNSCRRPWSTTMNARFSFDHQFGDQYHFVSGSINFWNPLGGLDQLLHGGDHLRGWGLPAMPDPALYYVRGFDQTTRQFIYEVNPRFGNSRPAVSALFNPFRITAELSFTLNGNVQHQRAEQMMRPTRNEPGVRPPIDTIYRRVSPNGISPMSPFYWVLANADSLLLTPEQQSAISSGAAQEAARNDSAFKALATELHALPRDFDMDSVVKRLREVNDYVFSGSGKRAAGVIRGVLTPIQLRLLPPSFSQSFDLGPTPPKVDIRGRPPL